MEIADYEVKRGKYISFRAKGKERFTRGKTLGPRYTEEAIRDRIERRTRAPRKENLVLVYKCGQEKSNNLYY